MNIQQTVSTIQSCEEAIILAKEQIKNYEELIRSLQNRMYTEFIESYVKELPAQVIEVYKPLKEE